MEEVIATQRDGEVIHLTQRDLGTRETAQGHRAVEANHGGVGEPQQSVVEDHDLGPVGLIPGRRLRVDRRDRPLQLVGAGCVERGRAVEQADPIGDLRSVPQVPVLVREQHHLPGRVEPGA